MVVEAGMLIGRLTGLGLCQQFYHFGDLLVVAEIHRHGYVSWKEFPLEHYVPIGHLVGSRNDPCRIYVSWVIEVWSPGLAHLLYCGEETQIDRPPCC